ncbi:MAG: ATP-binding protein [Mycobacteriales bacterium]|nr:ATP-binding protein [Frankia sp.]
MSTVELRFTPLPAHVRTARLIAAAVARRSALDESVIDEIKLAVGEACSRAVSVHRDHAAGDEVVVTITDDTKFTVAVQDRGPAAADVSLEDLSNSAFEVLGAGATAGAGDPAAPPLPPGFGLAMIAGLVDDVEVDSAAEGTIVTMRWPRPPAT